MMSATESPPIPWLSSGVFCEALAAKTLTQISTGKHTDDPKLEVTMLTFLSWRAWWEANEWWVAHWTNPIALVLMGGERRPHGLPDFYVFARNDAVRVAGFVLYCYRVVHGLDTSSLDREWAPTEKQPPTHTASPDCELLGGCGATFDAFTAADAYTTIATDIEGVARAKDTPNERPPTPALYPDRIIHDWMTYSPAGQSLGPRERVSRCTIIWDATQRAVRTTEFVVDKVCQRPNPMGSLIAWVMGGGGNGAAPQRLGDSDVTADDLEASAISTFIQSRTYKGFPHM